MRHLVPAPTGKGQATRRSSQHPAEGQAGWCLLRPALATPARDLGGVCQGRHEGENLAPEKRLRGTLGVVHEES